MTEDYESVLELVAENPGIEKDELIELADSNGIEDGADLLHQGLDREDVLEFNGRHWVMRKGRFSFDEYDHPEP